MHTLFEYYREPAFSIVLLICLALIAGLSSAAASTARAKYLRAKTSEFLSSLKPSKDLAPLSSAHLAEFGAALYAAGSYLRARDCYAILLDRGEAVAYELALCNIRMGLFSQGIACCEIALKQSGRDERALKALVFSAFSLGDLRTASDAARALALCSNDTAALEFLSGKKQLHCAALGDDESLLICPKCHKNARSPFCEHCFELITPQIFKRINYVRD